jgi:hypothetical protein
MVSRLQYQDEGLSTACLCIVFNFRSVAMCRRHDTLVAIMRGRSVSNDCSRWVHKQCLDTTLVINAAKS